MNTFTITYTDSPKLVTATVIINGCVIKCSGSTHANLLTPHDALRRYVQLQRVIGPIALLRTF